MLYPFILLSQNKTELEYIESGDKKSSLNDWVGAITDYQEAIRINPKSVDAYFGSSISKSLVEDYYGAINDISIAISIDNDDYEYYLLRAEYKYYNEDYYGSINDATDAINKLKPQENLKDYSLSFSIRGQSKSGLNDWEGAIKDYSEAIKYDLEDSYNYALRGYAKYMLDKFDDAIKDYSEAIKIDPEGSLYLSERGWVKYLKEDYDAALIDFNKSLELNPNDEVYFDRSFVKAELGDFYGAIGDVSKAIELKAKSEYFAELGNLKADIGDYKRAIPDILKAIVLDPENIEFKYLLILFTHNSGKSKEAFEKLNQNLKNLLNTPYAPLFYDLRGIIKIGLNESNEIEKGLGLNDKNGGCLDLKKGLELAKRLTEEDFQNFEYLSYDFDGVNEIITEFCN